MEEKLLDIIELLLNRPWQSAILIVSCGIFIKIVSDSAIESIKTLFQALVDEFRPRNDKSWMERINQQALWCFAILTFIGLIVEKTPSVFRQILGVDCQNENVPYLSLAFFLGVLGAAVISPYWVTQRKREVQFDKDKSILKKSATKFVRLLEKQYDKQENLPYIEPLTGIER